MASPYTSQSSSGYNSSAPADDGSAVASNQVLWSSVKTKLGDPVKTLADNINSALVTAFGKMLDGGSVATTAVDYTVLSADQGKLIRATASGKTITTPDATSVSSPFVFAVLNSAASGNITIDGSGAQTVNGAATVTVPAGQGCIVMTDGTNWFVIGSLLTTADVTVNSLTTTTTLAAGTTVTAGTGLVATTSVTGATVAGAMVAVQADMETGTATNLLVPPGRQHFHPGHPKTWASISVSAGTPTLDTSYNVTSIADTGSGQCTVTIATDFSTANWCVQVTNRQTGNVVQACIASAGIAAGTILLETIADGGANTDPEAYYFDGLGDQA